MTGHYIFGMPPPGNIPPMPRIILAIPPFAENFFIIFCICLCCLIKRPMSCTWVPEPMAIRRLREPLIISGSRRSAGVMDKLPNMGGVNLAQMGNAQGAAEKQFKQMEAIINSMTPAERRDPDLISGSRKRRIAMGSGTQVQDIGRLIKQHKQMQKMMKKFSAKGGMAKMMRGMGGMLPGGGMPKM